MSSVVQDYRNRVIPGNQRTRTDAADKQIQETIDVSVASGLKVEEGSNVNWTHSFVMEKA